MSFVRDRGLVAGFQLLLNASPRGRVFVHWPSILVASLVRRVFVALVLMLDTSFQKLSTCLCRSIKKELSKFLRFFMQYTSGCENRLFVRPLLPRLKVLHVVHPLYILDVSNNRKTANWAPTGSAASLVDRVPSCALRKFETSVEG